MKRHDKEKMRQMYDQWQSSGLSMTAFSQQNGIPPNTFYYWAKSLRKQDQSHNNTSGFSRIPAPQTDSDKNTAVTVDFPTGIRLTFYYPVEVSFIKELIQ